MNPRRFLLLCLLAGPLGLILVLSTSSLFYFLVENFFSWNLNIWTFLGIVLWGGLSILTFGAMYMLYRWTIKENVEKSIVDE
jgi:hypothetical protein